MLLAADCPLIAHSVVVGGSGHVCGERGRFLRITKILKSRSRKSSKSSEGLLEFLSNSIGGLPVTELVIRASSVSVTAEFWNVLKRLLLRWNVG